MVMDADLCFLDSEGRCGIETLSFPRVVCAESLSEVGDSAFSISKFAIESYFRYS